MNMLMMTGGGGAEQKQQQQEEFDEDGNKNTSVVMTGTTNMGPPQNKKHIVINTAHCRQEIDTVQYVISKCGYREQPHSANADGNILWYGMALRDHDIDIIKARKALINRYPLMDHFAKKNIFCVIISRL